MDDVVVIGGSYAGLTAALQLARARRKVTILDTGLPRNRFASEAHGVLGFDGKPPEHIREAGRDNLNAYPTVRFARAEATSAERIDGGFAVSAADGQRFDAARLIFSYGIVDQMPDLPGFAECWGKTVIHCPYCHGYEVAGGRLGLLYSSPMSLHGAQLIRDWTDDLTLFADGNAISDAERHKLQTHGVKFVPGKVAAIEHDTGRLRAVRLADGTSVELDAMFGHPRTAPSSPLHERLGVEVVDGPVGPYIKVDGMQQTSVEGIFAAGDAARAMTNVTFAIADGAMAGIACHRSLVI